MRDGPGAADFMCILSAAVALRFCRMGYRRTANELVEATDALVEATDAPRLWPALRAGASTIERLLIEKRDESGAATAFQRSCYGGTRPGDLY